MSQETKKEPMMMTSKPNRRMAVLCGVFIFATGYPVFGDTPRGRSAQTLSVPATPASVAQYVRDRFQVPDTVRVNAQPLDQSPFPHFYQTAVTVDDGKQKRSNDVFITSDALCFVVGNLFALSGASNAEIIRCVREAAKLPASAEVRIAPFAPSAFPDFLKSTVTVRNGTQVRNGELFVTRDHRTGILGLVVPFRRDFTERLIDTRNQPSIGPANAPVTIVEYADLECPTCAYFQKFLDNDLLPRYGSKVRVVFKEFPLPSHPWSMTAAVANECAYQIDSSTFFNYRTLIFRNQELIDATSAREQLLGLGQQAGLNRITLESCLDSKESQGRIEACRREAGILGVSRTPTFFVNGRIVVGVPPAPAFYAIVDQAIAAANTRN